MICYALGICFNFKDVTWYIPGTEYNANHFFAQKIVTKWKDNLTELCNALEPELCISMQRGGHTFYALKSKSGYCVIDCDTPISTTQIRWLFYHLLVKKLPMSAVANNLEAYTRDYKVTAIRQDLAELTVKLKEDIEKTFERGNKIQDLLAKTGDLATNSEPFRKIPKQEEPCWSTCSLS